MALNLEYLRNSSNEDMDIIGRYCYSIRDCAIRVH